MAKVTLGEGKGHVVVNDVDESGTFTPQDKIEMEGKVLSEAEAKRALAGLGIDLNQARRGSFGLQSMQGFVYNLQGLERAARDGYYFTAESWLEHLLDNALWAQMNKGAIGVRLEDGKLAFVPASDAAPELSGPFVQRVMQACETGYQTALNRAKEHATKGAGGVMELDMGDARKFAETIQSFKKDPALFEALKEDQSWVIAGYKGEYEQWKIKVEEDAQTGLVDIEPHVEVARKWAEKAGIPKREVDTWANSEAVRKGFAKAARVAVGLEIWQPNTGGMFSADLFEPMYNRARSLAERSGDPIVIAEVEAVLARVDATK